MTKEEYDRLLQSDYWKGYSYSLIKERDFTCEDCGRRFFNERNKLQVHHLVYRDTNPWSYNPDELVVLCEDCHKKRHGIYVEPESEIRTTNKYDSNGSYSKSYSYSTNSKEEKAIGSQSSGSSDVYGIPPVDESTQATYSDTYRRLPNYKPLYVGLGILFLIAIIWGMNTSPATVEEEVSETETTEIVDKKDKDVKSIFNQPSYSDDAIDEEIILSDNSTEYADDDLEEYITSADVEETVAIEPEETDNQLEDVDVTEEITNAKERPTEELSTLESIERQNHADVVKQAKQAGVSTEGSTLDILKRINHADAVKQAKQAGVSTEGSTLDILKRINHADVVKQAEQAGVSTEGSTLDILKRMNR